MQFKTVTGQIMNIYDDRVEITQEGVKGFLTQGLQGTKTYFYKDISSIQFKNCGWTNGFFEFTMAGGMDKRGGTWGGITNDNRVTFGAPTIGKAKIVAEEAEEVNQYLQERLKIIKSGSSGTIIQQNSTADEIIKFKNMMDEGIISPAEFEAKKKQLLGI